MNDDELLNEALELIYELRGDYLISRDEKYPFHRKEIDEVARVVSLLETRLSDWRKI